MKRHYLWAEFAIVFIFLILPPLFVNRGATAGNAFVFTPLIFVQFAIAMFLDIENRLIKKERDAIAQSRKSRFADLIQKLSWSAITFGSLLLIFAAFQLLSFLVPSIQNSNGVQSMSLPRNIGEWLLCVCMLAVGSYYEEMLYRLFMPEMLLHLMPDKKGMRVCIEIVCVVLFGMAHRYLGWAGVANAVLCGASLRLCYVKTGSIYTGTAVHFSYNLMMYLLMLA